MTAAVVAEPIVEVDRMPSEVAAPHVIFQESPASPEPSHTYYDRSSACQDSPEVMIDLTTMSDRPLLIVVIEDDDATPPPTQADDVPLMQEAYTGDVALKADKDRLKDDEHGIHPSLGGGNHQAVIS